MMQSNPFTQKSGWETGIFLGREEEMGKGEVAFGIASYGQAWDKKHFLSKSELSFHLYLQTMSLSNSFLELVTKL
jgi:hypothetical protein